MWWSRPNTWGVTIVVELEKLELSAASCATCGILKISLAKLGEREAPHQALHWWEDEESAPKEGHLSPKNW